MRALVVAASLLVPVPAYALEIGARLPTRYGEVIVVKNDGGVKNWTTYFPYGSICHTDLNLKTWLIVKRIVGEQTLLVVDFGVEITRLSCPHDTETNMPMRRRASDTKTMCALSMTSSFPISTEGIDACRACARCNGAGRLARIRSQRGMAEWPEKRILSRAGKSMGQRTDASKPRQP